MELLAPAGSYEALKAAVHSGADAVYIGGSKFSARASAHNFDNEELEKWIKYAHLYGVDIHVAANTLIKENETGDFLEYIGYLNKLGADAVIMQDLGMADAVHKMFPDLVLHASTQLTCASKETAIELNKLGFSRIVLARELDKKSIENIKKAVDCEIEIFVHGAICMSYSGQCLMSSMIGGRSGNRGYCAQPCRLPYKLENNANTVNKGYLLSPKDMCLAEHIEELYKIGVDSLKIEGRLKRSEYVSTVVGVYRKLLDEVRKPYREEINELMNAFNRSGFTDGYFTSKKGIQMMSYSNPSNVSQNSFTEDAIARCTNEIKKIPVRISATVKMGCPVVITISDGENTAKATGNALAEYAQKVSLSYERLEQQLKKLGNTPFICDNADIYIEDDTTIAIGEINSVRREAVEKLCKVREDRQSGKVCSADLNIKDNKVDEQTLTASVRTLKQAQLCIENGIERIYAPISVINNLKTKSGLVAITPPVSKSEQVDYSAVQINSIGQKKGRYFLNYRMNVTNSYTVNLFKDAQCVTLSPELTIKEITKIKKPCDTEIIAYGRIPLMTFENCPLKANNRCKTSGNALKDRMNEEFPLLCGEGCFCELLNSKPIYMADKIRDLKNTGVRYLRLDFTIESSEECEKIIKEYKAALSGAVIDKRKENTFTRGHFYKPVL